MAEASEEKVSLESGSEDGATLGIVGMRCFGKELLGDRHGGQSR